MLEAPDYYALREYLITFLEERAHLRPSQMPPGSDGEKIVHFPAAGEAHEPDTRVQSHGA